MEDNIKITDLDYVRLYNLLNRSKKTKTEELRNISVLEHEIRRAVRVNPRQISPDIVTMNTQVEVVDLDTSKTMTVKLVYPNEADFRYGKVSILSLLGSALLGYKVGSIISFNAPLGKKEMIIKNIIYQPESNGEYSV
jgi:regulator of nucleoside diphosphate kinase